MNDLGSVPYVLLVFVVLALAFGATHRWLEFGLGLRRTAAAILALAAGVAAATSVCWFTLPNPATVVECVDFTPDPSGRC